MLRSGLPYSEMVLAFTLLEDDANQHGEAFIGETVFTTRHETVRGGSGATASV